MRINCKLKQKLLQGQCGLYQVLYCQGLTNQLKTAPIACLWNSFELYFKIKPLSNHLLPLRILSLCTVCIICSLLTMAVI